MAVRIPLAEIEKAWPAGLCGLFEGRGIRLVNSGNRPDPSAIRFSEPCCWWWDAQTGELVVEQGG
jgi:hypothetical protein